MGIFQSFTGVPVDPKLLEHAIQLIQSSPYGRFKRELVILNRVQFFQKPPGNDTITAKGYKIFLSSEFFTLDFFRQAEILVHEVVHTERQTLVGLYWWIAKYLINPWYRLDEELAALSNEILWRFVWRRLLPTQWEAYAWDIARSFRNTYVLAPFISEKYIHDRVINLLHLQSAFVQTLTQY